MVLSRKDILEVNDLTTRIVPIPEWKGDVIIKMMTGTERDQFEDSLFEGRGKDRKSNYKNLRAKLLSMCLVGEDGKRLFSDKDIESLGGKSAKALDRLYTIATEINGIGAKEEEALIKNSESEGNDTSTSPSLVN